MIHYFTPIPEPTPNHDFSIEGIAFLPESNPFLKIEESDQILIEMQYAKIGIPQAIYACYLRQEVYHRLLKASKKLPSGYKFKIYDAWRPLAVQKFLYTNYREIITEQYQHLPPTEIENIINRFITPPSEDVRCPPAHTTGGAIDLTIVDKNNRELDMGGVFDEFNDSAHTRFFEGKHSSDIENNRRMLYNIMRSEGFTNLPAEWWHYDYGTNFWAFYTNCPSKYLGVFSEEEVIEKIKNKGR